MELTDAQKTQIVEIAPFHTVVELASKYQTTYMQMYRFLAEQHIQCKKACRGRPRKKEPRKESASTLRLIVPNQEEPIVRVANLRPEKEKQLSDFLTVWKKLCTAHDVATDTLLIDLRSCHWMTHNGTFYYSSLPLTDASPEQVQRISYSPFHQANGAELTTIKLQSRTLVLATANELLDPHHRALFLYGMKS